MGNAEDGTERRPLRFLLLFMTPQPVLQNQVDILAKTSIIRIGQSLYLVDYVFIYRNADLLLQRLLLFHFITLYPT